jgi:ribosomal protein S18 acetylase RimI-like enzyme
MKSTCIIKLATSEDEPFLWEMLYQSLYVESGSTAFPREIINTPEIARYVNGWGRGGDLGFIAFDERTKQPIGAIWSRLAVEEDPGFAFVDTETPELAMAVKPDCRGRGVGTALLERYLMEASVRYRSVSLSVSPQNPAMRLYERQGFKTVEIRSGHPVMVKQFVE